MLMIDLPSREIVGDIDFGHGVRPHCAVLDRTSGLLYVTTELDKTVTIVDPKTKKILGAVPTGQEESHMVALSHDGKRGYTANVGPGTVSVLDMVGRKMVCGDSGVGAGAADCDLNGMTSWCCADQTKPQLAVTDTATEKVKIRGSAAGDGRRGRNF
jgi:hypothetical protein